MDGSCLTERTVTSLSLTIPWEGRAGRLGRQDTRCSVFIERDYRQGGQEHFSPQGYLGPIQGSLLGLTLVPVVSEDRELVK